MNKEIKTTEDVKAFVQYLIDNDQLYHFDDEPSDIINRDNEAVFTIEECNLINQRIEEIYAIDSIEVAFEYANEYLENYE
jgi:hypothetical protein